MGGPYLETIAGPTQRQRAIGTPGPAVDQNGGTIALRLARAEHHGGARAVLGEGFDRQSLRHRPAVAEPADAAYGIARNAIPQSRILDGACITVGGKPLLDGEAVAVAVQHREPAIAPPDGCGLAVPRNQNVR